MPADIINIDKQPFAKEQKVLILENKDNQNDVNIDGVTCLFINEHNNLDVGYLKENCYSKTGCYEYIPVLFRSTIYTDKLSDAEALLEIISSRIKTNHKLGSVIHRFINNQRYAVYIINEVAWQNKDLEIFKGVSWKYLRKKFNM